MKLFLLALCLSQMGCYATHRVRYPDGRLEFTSGLGSHVEITPGDGFGRTRVVADTKAASLGAVVGGIAGGVVKGFF